MPGYVAGGLMRGLLVGASSRWSRCSSRTCRRSILIIIGSVLLTAIVFSLGGLFNAIFAKNFDQISWFPTFILTPLIYLGGVFYSVSLLPPWARSSRT